MNNYIINNKTCALIKKNNKTLIIEDAKTILLDINIKNILNYNCKYYGSDYNGRSKAVSLILSSKYKNPILISSRYNLILFPTSSIRTNNVMLINYKKIIQISYILNNIHLKLVNNKLLTLNISKYILNEQIIKCIFLENALKSRKY